MSIHLEKMQFGDTKNNRREALFSKAFPPVVGPPQFWNPFPIISLLLVMIINAVGSMVLI